MSLSVSDKHNNRPSCYEKGRFRSVELSGVEPLTSAVRLKGIGYRMVPNRPYGPKNRVSGYIPVRTVPYDSELSVYTCVYTWGADDSDKDFCDKKLKYFDY